MIGVKKVASYICRRYLEEYNARIDEMKLHKLLYFMQRESIVQIGEPMFDDTFKAWKYGPVMLVIRQYYKNNTLNLALNKEELEKYKSVFDKVFSMFASKKSWSLGSLSHGEYSWKKAREGFCLYDSCDVDIKTEDIAVDADRIRTRRFLLSRLNN